MWEPKPFIVFSSRDRVENKQMNEWKGERQPITVGVEQSLPVSKLNYAKSLVYLASSLPEIPSPKWVISPRLCHRPLYWAFAAWLNMELMTIFNSLPPWFPIAFLLEHRYAGICLGVSVPHKINAKCFQKAVLKELMIMWSRSVSFYLSVCTDTERDR